MYTKSFVSAVAALGLASGAAAVGCQDPTATVVSPADATAVGRCQDFKGSVLISKSYAGDVNFGGLQSVAGDITAQDNENITSISAQFLGTIGGSLTLKNLINMSSLQLQKLASVDKIDWATLRRLTTPSLGTPGITKASSIIISDTVIKNLNGINVDNIEFLNLNNNKDIVTFKSSLKTVSDQIIVDANGLKMEMDLPNLIWASNMTISNVTTFTAPSLKTVNGSLFFNSNYFTSVSFPNLTALEEGTFSFVSNPQLKNLTMPLLTTIGGGFIVANNTALGDVTGFSKLETIGGAIALRGSFKSFGFPALDDVRGAAEIRSTEDIGPACDSFKKDKGSEIQGDTVCEGKDSGANDNTGDADGSGGSSTGSSSGAFVVANKGTVFGLGLVAVFYTAFL